jgi:release factor glutamine methyltransferase
LLIILYFAIFLNFGNYLYYCLKGAEVKFYYNNHNIGLELEVPENVYYPAEDSLLMAEVLCATNLEGRDVLEIGSGSGFLSLVAAKKGAVVDSVDINKNAVEATAKNSENNSVKVNSMESDLFENIKGKYDLVMFNPPYLPKDGEDKPDAHSIQWSGGINGREVLEKFLSQARPFLKDHGKLLILISSLTGEKEVFEIMKKHGFSHDIIVRTKLAWEEIVVIQGSF